MPRTAINTEPLTFEQYLELEERQEFRHEFVDGFMFAMAGATMPEAPKPVRCCFKGKIGAFYGQEGRMIKWSREILSVASD